MKNKKLKGFLVGLLVLGLAYPQVSTLDTQAATVKPTAIKTLTSKNKKKTMHTLALGEIKGIKSAGSKATINVAFTPKNSGKGIRITSSDTDIVRVYKKNSSATSWTMMGIAEGKADLNIRSAIKSSLKTKIKITVKSKSPSYIKLSQSSLTLNPNDAISVGAMNNKANVNVTFNSTNVDRYINVYSSDESIVSVQKKNSKYFSLTAKKAGTANITVASSTNPNAKETFTVTVKSPVVVSAFAAKQTGANQVSVTFSDTQLGTVSTNNFTIKQKNSSYNWIIPVTSVTLSTDKKSATLTTAINLQKGTEYLLEYTPTNNQSAQSTTFTTSNGEVVRIGLKTTTCVMNVPKKLVFALYDDKGTDIADKNLLNNLDVSIDSRFGYYDKFNNTITIWQPDIDVDVKLSYPTGKFVNGIEQKIQTTAKIRSLRISDVTIVPDKVTINYNSAQPLSDGDWNKIQTGNNLVIPNGTTGAKLVVRVKASDGTYYSSDSTTQSNAIFSFSSNDTSIFTISNDGIISIVGSPEGKQGTVIINATVDGKLTQFAVNITVGVRSYPNTVIITPGGQRVAKGSQVKYEISVKDQYNNDLTGPNLSSLILIKQPSGLINPLTIGYNSLTKKNEITSTISGSQNPGNYSCEIQSIYQANRTIGMFTVSVY